LFLPDRRQQTIELRASDLKNYSIGVIGKYLYNEKLINVKTEGKIIALMNDNPSIPTRLIYLGNYNPLSDGTLSSTEADDNSGRIEGYLVDDLDVENKGNNKLLFLGPIGDFMAFIKCGVTECDVYYSEILVG
jgi:hypothetical protein